MGNTGRDPSDVRARRWLLALGAVGAVLLFSGLALLYLPDMQGLFGEPVPTPQCVEPTLRVGETNYRIQLLPLGSDGSLSVPAGEPGTAFWVEGTNVHYVFALSSEDVSMGEQPEEGAPIKITWADCTTDEYVVSSLGDEIPGQTDLLDQSTGGVTIFVAVTAAGSELLIQGQRPETLVTALPEPTDPDAVLLDVEFLESTISPDESTFTLGMKLTNRGSQSLMVTSQDISILPESGAPITALAVEPSLPQEIPPGEEVEIQLTFPNPDALSVVLKIFDTTLEYYLQ